MQTNSATGSPSAPELAQVHARFGRLLGKVYRQWRRQVDLAFRDLGLSDATRMPLLALYERNEAVRQKDLADTLYLESSSLVRVLAQLREAQLVSWDCDPADRRTKCIVLTPAGREVAELILAKSIAIEQAIMADVPPAELELTRRTLEEFARRFDEMNS